MQHYAVLLQYVQYSSSMYYLFTLSWWTDAYCHSPPPPSQPPPSPPLFPLFPPLVRVNAPLVLFGAKLEFKCACVGGGGCVCVGGSVRVCVEGGGWGGV